MYHSTLKKKLYGYLMYLCGFTGFDEMLEDRVVIHVASVDIIVDVVELVALIEEVGIVVVVTTSKIT